MPTKMIDPDKKTKKEPFSFPDGKDLSKYDHC